MRMRGLEPPRGSQGDGEGWRDVASVASLPAVVSEQMSDEALELFVDREMAELMVENWDRDEPNRAGELPSSRSNLRP
jgi:hypothetical protein